MTDSYLSIRGQAEGLYKEKGSRFIGYIFPVETKEQMRILLNEVKKEYHAARHWCCAYCLGADKKNFRAHDCWRTISERKMRSLSLSGFPVWKNCVLCSCKTTFHAG